MNEPSLSPSQRAQLPTQVRALFVRTLAQDLQVIMASLHERLSDLLNETCSSREMQKRRDAWVTYPSVEKAWFTISVKSWQELERISNVNLDSGAGLSLIEEDTVEDKMIASRMALRLVDKCSWALNDLTVRMKALEGTEGLSRTGVLRPESLCLALIESWVEAGMAREAWDLVQTQIVDALIPAYGKAYQAANDLLIRNGVMKTIDLRQMLKRTPGGQRGADGIETAGTAPSELTAATGSGHSNFGSGHYGGGEHTQVMPAHFAQAAGMGGGGTGMPGGGDWGTGETAPMMPQAPSRRHFGFSLERIRGHAEQVFGGIKRVLNQRIGLPSLVMPQAPTPALMEELAATMEVTGSYDGEQTTILVPPAQQPLLQAVPYDQVPAAGYQPVHVQQAQQVLREHANKLKGMTDEAAEKAIIELVALMFQNILHEDRIAPGIRIWIARLQMPVLRLALAEPVFFESLDHPARKLIDHLGACVLGFAGDPPTETLEREIKRMVQVIEQYPETGKRVFEIVYQEFKKFLGDYLPNQSDNVTRMVSLASQVEEKESLVVQYTIELRDRLGQMAVREEVRDFLYEYWPQVLAVSSIKYGTHAEATREFQALPPQLIWASAAKPSRQERQKAIAEVPEMLLLLRSGMALLGMSEAQQQAQIDIINRVLTDAFMSKTEPIDEESLQILAERLASVEDLVMDDVMADFELDLDSLELVLGFDLSGLNLIAGADSPEPSPELKAWIQGLLEGAWFRVDHNGYEERVQFCWRSEQGQLYLFVSADGNTFLFQRRGLAGYLQAGLILPAEEEMLSVLATRQALAQIQANPERLKV